LSKAAMTLLAEVWPGTIPFMELLRGAAAKVGREPAGNDLASLSASLLNAYIASDVIEVHAAPVAFARIPSEKPVALNHARVRAAEGRDTVANRRHESVRLSDLAKRLLPLLDGTRDCAALTDALTDL